MLIGDNSKNEKFRRNHDSYIYGAGHTYGICKNFSKKFEAPPCVITVTITMSDVVVSIACRASDTVFRMANANDMAPRNPAKNSMC